ncbi:hypothetical protein [Telluria aromaticivorans]|uniref:Uncharacterized protein n=1 Tax=Telluria aromaticivorans TaxID=2725995 RepID=A0A7Y2JX29_9BURK|nr:hypothetical protein [Telluria aromaticivorans]NNG22607.1 hypothetical protein [Telluria aromaticivorans]
MSNETMHACLQAADFNRETGRLVTRQTAWNLFRARACSSESPALIDIALRLGTLPLLPQREHRLRTLERGTEPGPVLLGHGLVHVWKFAID